MKFLIVLVLLSSPLLFGRAPAVNPIFSTTDRDGGNKKEFIYIKGEPVELSKVSFNAKGSFTKNLPPKSIQKNINLAPTFLMFFALSIPLFAIIFMRDEETLDSFSKLEDSESSMADVVEVDFKKDKEQKEIKKAS